MATSGDRYLATTGDFFMATDTGSAALRAATLARICRVEGGYARALWSIRPDGAFG